MPEQPSGPKKPSDPAKPRSSRNTSPKEESVYLTPEGEQAMRRLLAQVDATKRLDARRRTVATSERFKHPKNRRVQHRDESQNQRVFNILFSVLVLLLKVDPEDQSHYRKWVETLWPDGGAPGKDALVRFRSNFSLERLPEESLSELRSNLRHAGASLISASELLRPKFRNLIEATIRSFIAGR